MSVPRRGDVFYAPLQQTDLIEGKRRPVCVVSAESYNKAGLDAVVAMITSRLRLVDRPGIGDVVIQDWMDAGLKKPSVLRAGRLLTLDMSPLEDRVGHVSGEDLNAVDEALVEVLGLSA